jgi:hypothetical protein
MVLLAEVAALSILVSMNFYIKYPQRSLVRSRLRSRDGSIHTCLDQKRAGVVVRTLGSAKEQLV